MGEGSHTLDRRRYSVRGHLRRLGEDWAVIAPVFIGLGGLVAWVNPLGDYVQRDEFQVAFNEHIAEPAHAIQLLENRSIRVELLRSQIATLENKVILLESAKRDLESRNEMLSVSDEQQLIEAHNEIARLKGRIEMLLDQPLTVNPQ